MSSETDDRNRVEKSSKYFDESYNEPGKSETDKSKTRNPKKRLHSESTDDHSASTAKNYKRVSNLKNTSVQWLDAVPNGKLFIKYDVDYEEAPDQEPGSNITDRRNIQEN